MNNPSGNKQDLLDLFIEALYKKASSKKEVANLIAEKLNIEKESAYRRIGGKVQFTIREMGKLAKEMNISIDQLLFEHTNKTSILFEMNFTHSPNTMDTMYQMLEESISYQKKINAENTTVGAIFDSLPIEVFMYHDNLSKFMYFKWGRYHVGGKEFDHFSSWKAPYNITQAHAQLKEKFIHYKNVLYIWDTALIWNLVKEIKYYQDIHVLTPEDTALIKADLHQLLEDMMELLKETKDISRREYEFYVTHFNIALTAYYIVSDNCYLSGLRTPFLNSCVHDDYNTGYKIRKWIHSLKKVSSLISGSGEKERLLFFNEQHEIIDSI